MSVSRLPALLVFERGPTLRIELMRHLAPATVRLIWQALPLSGRIAWHEKAIIYFPVPLVVGNEKSRDWFRAGELGFMPSGSAICAFVKDTRTSKPINPIGRLLGDVSPLEAIPSGTMVVIKRME
jgi:hypothetical protein